MMPGLALSLTQCCPELGLSGFDYALSRDSVEFDFWDNLVFYFGLSGTALSLTSDFPGQLGV